MGRHRYPIASSQHKHRLQRQQRKQQQKTIRFQFRISLFPITKLKCSDAEVDICEQRGAQENGRNGEHKIQSHNPFGVANLHQQHRVHFHFDLVAIVVLFVYHSAILLVMGHKHAATTLYEAWSRLLFCMNRMLGAANA